MGRGQSRSLNTPALRDAIDFVAQRLTSGQDKRKDKTDIYVEIVNAYTARCGHRIANWGDTGVGRIQNYAAKRLKTHWGFRESRRSRLDEIASKYLGEPCYEEIKMFRWV